MIHEPIIPPVESYADTESIIDYDLSKDVFEENYSPLTKIKLHLIALSNHFNLGEVSFKPKNKNDWDSIDSFYIKSPEGLLSYEDISKIWDQIIDNTVKYAEKEGILSILNSVTIIIN